VESLSALVEDKLGELRLVDWREIMLRWEKLQFDTSEEEVKEFDVQPA
jgi:hypothetical protein